MKHIQRPRPSHSMHLLGAALLLSATGCSVLESDKIDYKSARQGNTLEVPPDLTQLPAQSRYALPGGAVTASGYMAQQPTGQQTATTGVAPGQLADVKFMRQDGQRWLHVQRPADELWSPVRDFWLENGFLLAEDQPKMGLMETDWAENRAKIPQDFIRNAIGKVLDGLYSTGERDKFRTRMERSASGGTDIFITHSGMEEVFADNQRERTVWKPRARDAELEAEFLRRLMVSLGGVTPEQAKQQAAQAGSATADGSGRSGASALAQSVTVNGLPAIALAEDFDHAWRRVGLALDRTGFTVEDRDRSQGTYYVRYIDPKQPRKEPGFFAKLFGRSAAPLPTEQYRIQLNGQGQQTTVAVLDGQGAPAIAAKASAIVQVLLDELK